MRLISTDNYIEFQCMGGDCPISCCGGNWGIYIDKEMADYYRSVEGEFGDRLRAGIEDIGSNTVFKLNENKDCIFLNENRLCEIYRNLGEDKLCSTCRTYPRSFFQAGDIVFCFLTNSCPEVTRMILQKKEPLETVFDDVGLSNDVAERITGRRYDASKIDWQIFDYSIQAFAVGINILQNREIPIKHRLVLLLLYIERFQEKIKKKRDPSDLTGIFSNPELYKLFLENTEIVNRERNYSDKIHSFLVVFRSLLKSSYSHPMWKKCNVLAEKIASKKEYDIDMMTSIFDKLNAPDYQIEMEQLITYRFLVSFMQGLDNTDYFEKIAYEYVLYGALITYMTLIEIEEGKECSLEDRILFYSLCSRSDHAQKGKKELVQTMEAEGLYKTETLLDIVS